MKPRLRVMVCVCVCYWESSSLDVIQSKLNASVYLKTHLLGFKFAAHSSLMDLKSIFTTVSSVFCYTACSVGMTARLSHPSTYCSLFFRLLN